jgi:triosephosphate isomerase
MSLAFENGLKPIYCVGERLEQREAGQHFDVVKQQIEEVIFNLSAEQYEKVIIAYEPVWAIGTGVTATAEQADEGNGYVREAIAEVYGKDVAETVTIQYGGSMNAKNADELVAKYHVDGGLIGGASLKAEDFSVIVKAASK